MRKVSDVLRRICALALCLCMMAQYMPMAGFAEEGTEAAQAVEETTEPTEATTEPMEATTAPTEETTEPTEETTVPTEETTEPAEATEATEAETAGKVITAWTWVEPEEEEDRILDPETGEVYLSTTQEDPIPMELLTAALPAAILATVEDAEETVTLGPWTCEDYPAEGAYAGDYTFVTTLPEGYTLAEGVAALEVMVRFEEPEVLADGLVNSEEELRNALQSGGTITLGTNITIKNRITINKNMTLDLGGYTLTYSGSDGGSIRGAYGVFTLESGNFTVRNGKLTQNIGGTYLRCFNVNNGTLTIEGVTIQGFSSGKGGGAISIEQNGTCNMESGTISGNSAWGKEGGGVYVRGTFNMTGGEISNNNVSSGYGGGVYVGQGGTFTMKGGTISQNQARSGGGVYVYSNGTFTMTGGAISNNTADYDSTGDGGGVKVYSGTFTMTGGTISNNQAQSGGGVYVEKNSFTMEGGTITNNTANAAGGGVCMYSGSFTMSGGSITGNQAGGDGKGVSIGGSVSYKLSGTAKITENTGNGTGNLYINTGGNAERSITNLTAGAQLDIFFSRPTDAKVATGDQGSLGHLTCENNGYVFTLENANELWVKRNRMAIITQPTGQKDLKYDGKSHVLLVDAGAAEEGGTMLYAVTRSGSAQPQEKNFSKELPSGTYAWNYTVWYYAKGDGDKADSEMQKLDVTIEKKPLGVTWDKKVLTYNGIPQRPTATLTGRVDGDRVWLEINNPPTDAGTYTTTTEDLKLTGGDAGNYFLADDVKGTKFTIQPAPLTITANPKTITYGDAPANDGVIYEGFKWIDDERCLEGKLDYTYDYKQYDQVDCYTITPKGLTSKNYNIDFKDGPLFVEQKTISINWGSTTYTYDGTPWAPSATAGGMVNGDELTLTVTGQKTDAGDYTAAVTEIQGDKAGNYKLPDNCTTSFTISKKPLTVTAQDKNVTYGDAAPTYTAAYDGFVPGEDKEDLNGKLVFTCDYAPGMDVSTYDITLKGQSSDNYDIQYVPGRLKVVPRVLQIQWSDMDLVYNGKTQAPVATATNVYGTDVLTLKVTGGKRDAGDNYEASVQSITGEKVHNYTWPQRIATTYHIEPRPVTVSGITAKDKTYDGTTRATLDCTGVVLNGKVEGDDLTVTATGSFDSADAGMGKTVTISNLTLGGSARDNYVLAEAGQQTTATAAVSAQAVTVSGITAQDKPFDGNTEATLNLRDAVLEGVVEQDREKLGVTATGTFASANVGTDKTVNIGNLALTGEKAANYVLAESQQKQTTAAITPSDRYLDLTDIRQTLWADGQPLEEMHDDGDYLYVPEGTGLITTYTMSADGSYPTGMKVYRVNRDSAKEQGVTLEEITAFHDLLLYGGCSIRLTGTKGIRMITGISETTRAGLTGTDGLAGYTLEEYGTVVMRGTGTPTLENSQSHNYAYKKGQADPIFGRTGGRIQFTNVLVGFSLKDCKDTLTLRPYIILKDTATGEALTLYGGCVTRSIGYVAKQNANTYQPGTAGYNYVHEIINAVYGESDRGGEK